MTTSTSSPPTVAKWPFYAGDGLCIVTMGTLLSLADRPLSGGVATAAGLCLLIGVVLAVIPFLIEYEARLRLAEAAAHVSVDGQTRKAAGFAEQLNHSVSRSQSTAEEIEKVLALNEELMEKMTEHVEGMGQWMIANREPDRGDDREWGQALKPIEAEIHQLSRAITALAGRDHVTPDDLRVALDHLRQSLETDVEKGDEISPSPDGTAERLERTTDTMDTPADDGPSSEGLAETGDVQAYPTDEPSAHGNGGPRFTFSQASTSLIVSAYIGIGNKLFLRGEGRGLSWQEGVPMQFLSIGKWGWSALDVEAPITCRIYKNDDEPSIDGDIILNPSELKEVSPRF